MYVHTIRVLLTGAPCSQLPQFRVALNPDAFPTRRWDTGVVPYVISPKYGEDAGLRRGAVNEYPNYCVWWCMMHGMLLLVGDNSLKRSTHMVIAK